MTSEVLRYAKTLVGKRSHYLWLNVQEHWLDLTSYISKSNRTIMTFSNHNKSFRELYRYIFGIIKFRHKDEFINIENPLLPNWQNWKKKIRDIWASINRWYTFIGFWFVDALLFHKKLVTFSNLTVWTPIVTDIEIFLHQ